MKLRIYENKDLLEDEIIINCSERNSKIERLASIISTQYISILGKKPGGEYVLNIDDIYYFESVDNHMFAYVERDVFEINYKITDLTELLKTTSFIQTSRTLILNISKIIKIKTLVNGRISATLKNKEEMIITRVYANEFKRKLKE